MMKTVKLVTEHVRIIRAVMFRELATRFGRNNLGFMWVVAEPMVFCIGVLILWHGLRGNSIENGIPVLPFVVTGYMPTILTRHMVGYTLNSIKANNSLLYHRQLTVLDLYFGRMVLEFIGVTLATLIVWLTLMAFGLAALPKEPEYIYIGWMLDALLASGMALMLGAISELVEVVEKVVGVTLYILVPLSGTFFMADWMPPSVRRLALLVPFLDVTELVRRGYFGNQVTPHYHIGYTIACGLVMVFLGLLLVRQVRHRIEVY